MVLEKLRLDARVAIVTGGSRGLGKAMALDLARAGADLCIAARTSSQLEAAADEIEAATGRRPLTVPTNVQSSAACDHLIAHTVERYGRLDIMVNNAGIGDARGRNAKLWDLSDSDWHDSIEVNLYSTFYCSRAASKVMHEQGHGGAILNISSGTALRSATFSIGYAAAKAAVISLTKSLASVLAGEDIRVNCIIPGFVAQHPPQSVEEAERIQSRGRFNVTGRTGEAWELGPLALWLCSDAASYVTGESFVIDGGGLAGGIAPAAYAMSQPAGAANA
jgi:NAD(P)-dependent dehydrogenase (short-subunit alcohol dehydrogenase family)